MNELIAVATLVVTAVGLWFAYSYSRQMALKLSETRLEAYSRLWEISGVAAPTRLDGWGDDGYLLPSDRRDLWAAMTDWYYAQGGGMLLTATTKDVYLKVKHNLICESSSDLHPAGLAEQINEALGLPAGSELNDKVRGTLAIRLISLLRTQLKSDLAIYGATYSGKLNYCERFFLIKSGVDLRSKAWAKAAGLNPRWRWIQRKPKVADRRPKETPEVTPEGPQPQPSPLQGMRAILSVGKIAKTPLSSRMAMSKALGSADADTSISNSIPSGGDVEHRPSSGP